MILEISSNDGKSVIGGNFMFVVDSNKVLSILVDGKLYFDKVTLKDYPTYNVERTMVYCEVEEE